ncbi:glutathione S-transferase domain protein [Pseudogulbenkiania sp. NH8B]|uniref:glutathione S-transferase family protein n=1 Tax=Pseudogulbenkiania sp. (strain NH8B) TaxID=748280 RepID=UPI000227992B|nr:glutathione S-transferase [Pseudogulbenkiania sp. NH8B]BAK76250.1 glutathione S-transferase domain protein [Pseudogulbenkiania sp. NH8B]
MLKILGKSSSINVRKVLWLCEELGLPYAQKQYGSGFQATDTPEFMALNPNAMVPVLIDDDFVLWESNTICRYLAGREQRFDLLPGTPRERALVEKWMDWQATELNNSWRYAFMALVRRSPAHADPEAIEAGVAGWNRHMAMVEAQLSRTGAYIAGASFTLADIVIGLSTHRWYMTPMPRPALPAVAAYYERLSERPGYRLHGRNGTP